MSRFDPSMPYPSRRSAVHADRVVCTSQPLAAQAGLAVLRDGGNAVDAALATAIALTVVEPTANGVGGDAFALVWDGRRVYGLNASGRAPAQWTARRFEGRAEMPRRGWDSVTVPGTPSAWVALSERFGRLPFARLFDDAIRYAADGFPVSPMVAEHWSRVADRYSGQPGFDEAFLRSGRAPRAGERFALPELARTLGAIADSRGAAFYDGPLAATIVAHANAHGGVLSRDDLASHQADWCEPLQVPFADGSLVELPPNGQGLAALLAAGVLERVRHHGAVPDGVESVHLQIEAAKLATADAAEYLADPDSMRVPPEALIDPGYLDERAARIDPKRAQVFGAGTPRAGGTVCVETADADGMLVSYIQSNFEGFGSGIVVPGTGIAMHNRGWGFVTDRAHPNGVAPRRRPFHTIIPGLFVEGGRAVSAFGFMGGPMQAQGHLQLLCQTRLNRRNPQAACDVPRWRFVAGLRVAVENAMPASVVEGLRALGHDVVVEQPEETWAFGGAQVIERDESGWIAGSDPRKDGAAVGF